MAQAIENSELNVKQIMNTINENYRNFLQANIAYRLQLKDMVDLQAIWSVRCITR